MLSDGNQNNTVGFFWMRREMNSNSIVYTYTTGEVAVSSSFSNFFQNLDDQWIHIVFICDYANKTLKIYRNGIQFGSTANLLGTPLFPSTNRTKFIGSYGSASHRLTDGSLDEVKIYNRGLSASEIASIYNQTKGKYQ